MQSESTLNSLKANWEDLRVEAEIKIIELEPVKAKFAKITEKDLDEFEEEVEKFLEQYQAYNAQSCDQRIGNFHMRDLLIKFTISPLKLFAHS